MRRAIWRLHLESVGFVILFLSLHVRTVRFLPFLQIQVERTILDQPGERKAAMPCTRLGSQFNGLFPESLEMGLFTYIRQI